MRSSRPLDDVPCVVNRADGRAGLTGRTSAASMARPTGSSARAALGPCTSSCSAAATPCSAFFSVPVSVALPSVLPPSLSGTIDCLPVVHHSPQTPGKGLACSNFLRAQCQPSSMIQTSAVQVASMTPQP